MQLAIAGFHGLTQPWFRARWITPSSSTSECGRGSPWHTKSPSILPLSPLTILETGGGVVRGMDLSFASNCIAIRGKPLMEFVIRIRAFGRWHICRSRFGNAINARVYALNNDRRKVTDHPVSKSRVLRNGDATITNKYLRQVLYRIQITRQRSCTIVAIYFIVRDSTTCPVRAFPK